MTLVKPTLFQLALAHFVERTRPPSIAIQDYIKHLRSQLAFSSNETNVVPSSINAEHDLRISSLPHEYASNLTCTDDATEDISFWRSKCAEANGRADACKSIVSDHERTIDELKARLRSYKSREEEDTQTACSQRSGSGKRKPEHLKMSESCGVKRRRVDKGSPFDGVMFPYFHQSAEEQAISATGEGGQKLLEQLYDLRDVFQLDSPDAGEVAKLLIRTGSTIANLFKELTSHQGLVATLTETESVATKPRRTLNGGRSVFRALSGAIVLLRCSHDRFASLPQLQTNHSLVNSATYSYLALFRTLIQCLDSITQKQSDSSQTTSSGRPTKRSKIVILKIPKGLHTEPAKYSHTSTRFVPASPPESPKQSDPTDLAKHEDISMSLLAFVPPASTAPSMSLDIVEGLTCLLLSRAGELIYQLTFGRPRAPSIEAEICTASSNNGPQHLQALRSEASALLPTVTRLLPLTSTLLARNSSDLAAKAKASLQRTLITSIFGDLSQHHKAALAVEPRQNPFSSRANYRGGTAKVYRHAKLTAYESVPDRFEDPFEAFSEKDRTGAQVQENEPARHNGPEAGEPDFVRTMWELCGWEVLKDVGVDDWRAKTPHVNTDEDDEL